MTVTTAAAEGLAGKLARVLEPAELAELAALIGPAPGEHAVCADMARALVADAAGRGRAEGWLRCRAEDKAAAAGLYADLRLERARWAVLCARCSRAGRRDPRCRDCQDGSRASFGAPRPGDYGGGPVPWEPALWLVTGRARWYDRH
jgi:hypothetical protein